MGLRCRYTINILMPLAMTIALVMVLAVPPNATAQNNLEMPEFQLDALEGFVWSSSELYLAPGQTIVITNRDVARHTFTVDAWDIDLNLPSLQPQEVQVPEDVSPGDRFEFYSSVPGDREGGLEGTIVIVTPEDVIAGQLLSSNLDRPEPEARVRIEARDDFTFSPAIVSVAPGTIIEVVNTGVISHHFAVDAWDVNQTINPGSFVLIRVPDDVEAGSSVDFYCSVPGHAQQGMVGVLRVTSNQNEISTVIRTGQGGTATPIDFRPFVPEADAFGDGWSRIRTGSSESILGNSELNTDVFPYSGLGAVYVGPNGARATVVVLPLSTDDLPNNQISESVRTVQNSLASSWSVDRIASAAWRSVSPPNGCTVAERVSGIVPIVTLPGGVTSCQLTGVGVALFVAVEGVYDGRDGVLASDSVVAMIISGQLAIREHGQ